ncbi:MAG TPA: class F sortase, partial [Candidatus Eisenbacteria bacterium]|nr:class F sortase [Candidatus Eisenbacteria bacterium]
SRALVGLGAALLALGFGLLAAGLVPAAGGPSSHAAAAGPGAPASSLPASSAAPSSPSATTQGPWWRQLPAATGAFVPAALVIEKLHVDAPIEVKSTDASNVMEAPDRPADVAWYRFTAKPGSGSNAVFSGHRDFARVGPAVFWRLGELVPGDAIDVVSPQQTEIRYRVSQTWDYSVSSIPMQQVLATDVRDEVTLLTCWGRYTPGAGYDRRLVVRALRTP